jgi:hypothetical protein
LGDAPIVDINDVDAEPKPKRTVKKTTKPASRTKKEK